jgi:sugar phosphate isomerase/epimerase
MHLGIFAKTFPRPTLEETLDAIAERGLTHVQFNMSCAGLPTLPPRIEEEYCRSIARALRDRGLTMAAISGTFNLCDPDADRLRENLDRLEVIAEACRWLDTRIITLCTGTLDPDDMWRWHPENVRRSTWDTLIESMTQAVKIADRQEVTLAFEPEIHNVVDSVSKARRLLDQIGSPWLKVVIDPANLIRPGELTRIEQIFDEAFDWLGPDIVLAHAKDPHIDEKTDAAGLAEMVKDYCLERGPEMLRFLLFEAKLAEAASPFEAYSRSMDPKETLPLSDADYREIFRCCFFYRPYFRRLKQIGYDGAIVIHGLEETEVPRRASYLGRILHGPRFSC